MDKHIITLDDVCGSYLSTIASDPRGGDYKRLCIDVTIGPSHDQVEFVVETRSKGVIRRTESLDEAVRSYNNA